MKERLSLVGLRGRDQGREVVLITGGSLVIRDGLETEKGRPFWSLCVFDELFLDCEGAKRKSEYLSRCGKTRWEGITQRSDRSERRRLIAFFLFGFPSEPGGGGARCMYVQFTPPTNLEATASVNRNSRGKRVKKLMYFFKVSKTKWVRKWEGRWERKMRF